MSALLTNVIGVLFKRTGIRPAAPRPRRAAPSVEALEDRITPAGGFGNDVILGGLGQDDSAAIDNNHGSHVAGTIGSAQDTGISPILKYLASDPSASGVGSTNGSAGGGGKVSMRDFPFVVKLGAAIDPFGLIAGAPGGHVKVEGGGNDVLIGGLGQDDSAASTRAGTPNRLRFWVVELPATNDLSAEDATRIGAGGGKVSMRDFPFAGKSGAAIDPVGLSDFGDRNDTAPATRTTTDAATTIADDSGDSDETIAMSGYVKVKKLTSGG